MIPSKVAPKEVPGIGSIHQSSYSRTPSLEIDKQYMANFLLAHEGFFTEFTRRYTEITSSYNTQIKDLVEADTAELRKLQLEQASLPRKVMTKERVDHFKGELRKKFAQELDLEKASKAYHAERVQFSGQCDQRVQNLIDLQPLLTRALEQLTPPEMRVSPLHSTSALMELFFERDKPEKLQELEDAYYNLRDTIDEMVNQQGSAYEKALRIDQATERTRLKNRHNYLELRISELENIIRVKSEKLVKSQKECLDALVAELANHPTFKNWYSDILQQLTT